MGPISECAPLAAKQGKRGRHNLPVRAVQCRNMAEAEKNIGWGKVALLCGLLCRRGRSSIPQERRLIRAASMESEISPRPPFQYKEPFGFHPVPRGAKGGETAVFYAALGEQSRPAVDRGRNIGEMRSRHLGHIKSTHLCLSANFGAAEMFHS